MSRKIKSTNNLLIDLIKINSESGNELEICNFVFNLLKKGGFKVKKIPVNKKGFNIIAKIGKPKVYLSAHLDTVKGFLDIKQTKDKIFGRGSCDTKASVATMIKAAVNCKNQNLKDFGLIFTIGEEDSFQGVKKIIKSKINIPFVIVGEPTSLEIVNGHFGILNLSIIARGKKAHSINPQKGINAIVKLIKAIELIKSVKRNKKTSLNVARIEGGVADNIIPDKAKALISLRIALNDKKNYLKEFKKSLKGLAKIKKEMEVSSVSTKIPKELSFIKKNKTARYLTELSFYRKGVVLGPGNIKFAHSDNEQIRKSELKKAVKIYKKIIKNYNKKNN
jgi:acetylornithine deacetylase